jgi:hypothetical protein
LQPQFRVLRRGNLGIFGRRGNYSGLSPSASNCRLHSVGGSRSPSMPAVSGMADSYNPFIV